MATPALRRIAIVSPNFYPRTCGVGDHSARLAVECIRSGHAVTVFSRSPAERNPETPEVAVHGADGQTPGAIADGVAQAMAAYAPTDVLIQYTAQMWDTWRFGSTALIRLAARARAGGARVTLVAHELYVPWRRRPDLAVSSGIQRLQLAALLANVDRFFVTTNSRAEAMRPVTRLLRLPAPEIVRVGPNALPVMSNRVENDPEGPRLGVFSTAAAGKRFDVVLDAFAALSREFPASQLILIGDLGPPESERVRRIVDTITRHPAGGRIRLTGKLPLAEVAREIASLDVYLFPMDAGANTRSGTLPVALGSGVPVVAVVGVDTDPIFRDGENIVFAHAMDGPSFASAAARLFNDRQLSQRVAEGGRRLHDRQLSWRRIAETLLSDGSPQRETNGFSTTK